MRVDHIGSLLRPQSLIDAFLECGRGEIDSSELEGLQDDAIREVVRKQEAAGDLLRRIEDAQQYIDIDQLAISPQCGFASGIGGNHLNEQQQWQKLELMLAVAGKVWGLS